jgi:hypothetical protein
MRKFSRHLDNLPNSVGTMPLKELSFKYKLICIAVILPNSDGNEPVNRFDLILKVAYKEGYY